MEVITIEDLKKYYSVSRSIFRKKSEYVKALDGIDLAIFKGEILAVVGESGCGKSTLGRLIVKLEEPSGGKLFFYGDDITKLSGPSLKSFRKRIQIVFQDPYASLNPRQPVGKIIEEGLVIHNMGTAKERKDKVLELMKVVGLKQHQAGLYPHEFSGGQRQRICIARSLALEPEVLILDEPLSALDVSIQAQVINLLLDLQSAYRLTYVFISHDLSVVRYIADRVCVMYLGHIVELSEKGEIFSNPLHPYTQMLFQAIPVSHPRLRSSSLKVITGEPANSSSTLPACPFCARCLHRADVCSHEKPSLKEVLPKHFVRCHFR